MVAPRVTNGEAMRFVFSFVLSALFLAWLALPGADGAAAFSRMSSPPSDQSLTLDAKIVCGDFGQGYTCRREPGAIRRGKMPKVPRAGSSRGSESSTGGGWFGGGDDEDALPPPAPGTGASSGKAASEGCPPNSERLGGHCIQYTQTCRRDLAANAPPQVCQNAEEKLVCDFRADGLKDCCCRTYSKF
jgi:hypothetical protein